MDSKSLVSRCKSGWQRIEASRIQAAVPFLGKLAASFHPSAHGKGFTHVAENHHHITITSPHIS